MIFKPQISTICVCLIRMVDSLELSFIYDKELIMLERD